MSLNAEKCKILNLSTSKILTCNYEYGFTQGSTSSVLEHVQNIKDLGVVVENDLHFSCHISEKNKQSISDAWFNK